MLHFKPEVDFKCVQDLISMVVKNELFEKKSEALDHAFYIGGTVNAYFASHKQPEVFSMVSVPNELHGESALMEVLSQNVTEQTKAINPVIAMLLKKLIEHVLSLLK